MPIDNAANCPPLATRASVANAPGRFFYERIGGVIIGERDDFTDGELIPLVVYEWADLQELASGADAYL